MCTGDGVGAEDDLDRWIGEHVNECVNLSPTGLLHPCERNRGVVTDSEESVSVVKVVLVHESDLRAEARPVLGRQPVLFYRRLSLS